MTQDYYGTKRVTAWPEAETLPAKSKAEAREGYAVRYADGYTSWSPADVFEAAYQPVTAMTFGHALAAMRDGHSVTRAGFGVARLRIKPAKGPYEETLLFHTGEREMKWDPDSDDVLASDWMIVEAG